MKPKLETLTHLAIIALCLIVSAVLVQRHFLSAPAPQVGVVPGQEVELPASMALVESRQTLVLALSPQCRFCTESLPFYRELMRRRDAEGSELRVVALVSDEAAVGEEQEILEKSDIQLDALASADFGSLGIPGTPMMLLVNRDGEAVKVWKGKLTTEAEAGVLATLGLDRDPSA